MKLQLKRFLLEFMNNKSISRSIAGLDRIDSNRGYSMMVETIAQQEEG